MQGKRGIIVEFVPQDGLGWIELDEGGRVRFGGNSLTSFEGVAVGKRVEVRGTEPGYKGAIKAVTVVPLEPPPPQVKVRRVTEDAPTAPPRPLADVIEHLHKNGLAVDLDAAGLAAAARVSGTLLQEAEVMEALFCYYGHGRVVGVAANERAARDGVIVFKESHSVEDEEEVEARSNIVAVIARFGVTVDEAALEDLGDWPNVAKAIDAALTAAGRPERTRCHESRAWAIGVVLIRERLVDGPLRLCSPRPGCRPE